MNRFRVINFIFLVFFLFLGLVPAFSQVSFVKGEEFFLQNRPEEALEYLKTTVADDPAHVQAFLYLGIVYQQLERPEDAIAAYMKILPRAGTETARVAYNLGNAYFSIGNAEAAALYYSQAIQIDPSMPSAYLNRANSLIKTGDRKKAVNDYEQYLALEPHSAQREEIERLIAFILEEESAAVRLKFETENSAHIELDRRRRLMEEVSASLQSVAEDSKIFSLWAEDYQNFQDFEDIEGIFETDNGFAQSNDSGIDSILETVFEIETESEPEYEQE